VRQVVAAKFFFLKAPRSTGSHVRFWVPTLTGLNADEATRVFSERAILRHTHTSIHTRTPTHMPQHPMRHQCCDHGESKAGGQPRNREHYHRATGLFACRKIRCVESRGARYAKVWEIWLFPVLLFRFIACPSI